VNVGTGRAVEFSRPRRSRANLISCEPVSRQPRMSRNFYILALRLVLRLIQGMTLVPSNFQPGLPANGSLWRTMALLLLLAALASASSRTQQSLEQ